MAYVWANSAATVKIKDSASNKMFTMPGITPQYPADPAVVGSNLNQLFGIAGLSAVVDENMYISTKVILKEE